MFSCCLCLPLCRWTVVKEGHFQIMDTENIDEPKDTLPKYIKVLLSKETPLDFHAVVGDTDRGSVETFGVDKWMLIAKNPVMEKMILESPLRHETKIEIKDVEPEIFKHFLLFIYGHDILSTLPVEEALDLLYVAEKYQVLELKNRLQIVLELKLQPNNIFTFLQYAPVCKTAPELWQAVIKTIQTKTHEIFPDPNFLEASQEAVSLIIEQDNLNVLEIHIWKAAVSWAKYQVTKTEAECSSENIYKVIKPLLKHIRLSTLSPNELFKEVISAKLLNALETGEICHSIGQKENCRVSNWIIFLMK